MRQREENIIKHPRCPYCKDEVRPDGAGDDAGRGCAGCLTWSHVACWRTHGSCASCGREEKEPEPEPSAQAVEELKSYLGLTWAQHPGGARVTEVARGSIADEQGLQAGDVITHCNGRPTSMHALSPFLDRSAGGKLVVLKITRRGQRSPGTVDLGVYESMRGWFGAKYESVPEGLRIVEIEPASPAAKAGLQPGDIIAKVDGLRASDLSLDSLLSSGLPGDHLRLHVARQGTTLEVDVVLAEHESGSSLFGLCVMTLLAFAALAAMLAMGLG